MNTSYLSAIVRPRALALAVLISVLFICGCQTTGAPVDPKARQAAIAAAVTEPLVSVFVPKFLEKNPGYESVLQALATGINAVFAGKSQEITLPNIETFIDKFAADNHLSDTMKAEILVTVTSAYNTYKVFVPDGSVVTTSPYAQMVATAFTDGIIQGIYIYHQSHPSA